MSTRNYTHATIVVTVAVANALNTLSEMLDRGDCGGMFTTSLSATGNLPATHKISSGWIPLVYLRALDNPAKLETAARAAYAAEGIAFPYTTTQIVNALDKCTISDGTFNGEPEGPHEMLARLGLKIISPPA